MVSAVVLRQFHGSNGSLLVHDRLLGHTRESAAKAVGYVPDFIKVDAKASEPRKSGGTRRSSRSFPRRSRRRKKRRFLDVQTSWTGCEEPLPCTFREARR